MSAQAEHHLTLVRVVANAIILQTHTRCQRQTVQTNLVGKIERVGLGRLAALSFRCTHAGENETAVDVLLISINILITDFLILVVARADFDAMLNRPPSQIGIKPGLDALGVIQSIVSLNIDLCRCTPLKNRLSIALAG